MVQKEEHVKRLFLLSLGLLLHSDGKEYVAERLSSCSHATQSYVVTELDAVCCCFACKVTSR